MKQKIISISYFFLIIIATIVLFSCQKENNNSIQKEFPQNQPITLKSSNLVNIRASDVISKFSFFKRKIEIIDRINNSVFKTFLLTVVSEDNTKSIYESIKAKTLTGQLTIESEGKILLKYKSINGKDVTLPEEQVKSNSTANIKSYSVPCTVSTVHDCVAYKIADMNWIEYSLCLLGAPECYAGLWASCTWDVCVKQKEYPH